MLSEFIVHESSACQASSQKISAVRNGDLPLPSPASGHIARMLRSVPHSGEEDRRRHVHWGSTNLLGAADTERLRVALPCPPTWEDSIESDLEKGDHPFREKGSFLGTLSLGPRKGNGSPIRFVTPHMLVLLSDPVGVAVRKRRCGGGAGRV